jgi:beta-glucanase (GH16 family)
MDDSLYFTSVNDHTGWEAWPFDKPFYLILNIAVGGSWGGQKGIDDTIWPQKMEVDYVRVYRLLVK